MIDIGAFLPAVADDARDPFGRVLAWVDTHAVAGAASIMA
jgi:hypothetical protein